MLSLRKDGSQCFRHALQAVRDGDQNVIDPTGLEFAENAGPKGCALVLAEPHPQDVASSIRADAES